MKARFALVLVLSCIAYSSVLWAQNEGGPKSVGGHNPVGPKYVDSVYVKISFDPRVTVDSAVLYELLSSPDVHGAALREANGKKLVSSIVEERKLVVADEELIATLSLNLFGSTVPGEMSGYLRLQLGEPAQSDQVFLRADRYESKYRQPATRFISAVCEHLERALDEIAQRELRKQLKQEVELLAGERKVADQAVAELRDNRAKLAEVSAGIPQSVLEESVSNLQRQQQALELELAGMKGRAEAIQQRLAKSAEEVKKEEKQDEIVKNLERVLSIRAQQLERYRALHKAATVPESEVLKAEEDVAMAQVELAQTRRLAAKGKTDEADRLNSQLTDIAIGAAEAQTKLQFVEKRLEDNLEKLRRESTIAAPLRDEIQATSTATQQMVQELRRRESQIRALEASFKPTSVETFTTRAASDDSLKKKGPREK
jgi:hypothetical protein